MNALKIIPSHYEVFVGLDVDKRSYSLTIRNHFGVIKSKKMPSRPESFYTYIKKAYPEKKIVYAYEAGPTGYGLYDYLESRDQQCLVISPNAVLRASNERVKTNRIDSNKVSELLKAGLLKSIRVPQEEYRELRHLANVRKNYVRKRKTAKQQIAALLLFENIRLPIQEKSRWSRKHIQILERK